jgi:hypothetical protein
MRLSAVLLVNVPDVPVIDTPTVPVGAVALAVKVSTLFVAAGFGANDAVTPLGRPEAAKVTPPANPFEGFTVIVLVPPLPCTTPTLFGEEESVNDGGPLLVDVDPPQPLRMNARQPAEMHSSPSFSRSIKTFPFPNYVTRFGGLGTDRRDNST